MSGKVPPVRVKLVEVFPEKRVICVGSKVEMFRASENCRAMILDDRSSVKDCSIGGLLSTETADAMRAPVRPIGVTELPEVSVTNDPSIDKYVLETTVAKPLLALIALASVPIK